MQSDVQSHFNRRNDYLNRSAIISTQNNNQLQTLNTLRDSVTPVKEFAPPANLVTIEQSFNQPRQVDILYHTNQAKNDESFPQASNYSTLQDDRTNHQTKSAYNTGHLDHTPTKQVPPAHNLPLQLTSSLTSNQLLSNRGGSNIEYIDVLIKEKQELQHSLNIEIQRRLLLEREVQTSMNGVLEEKQRLCKQLESLKGELEKTKSQRNQSSTEKEASLEALRLLQGQFIAAKQEIDQQNAKINAIQQENEVLKLQITSSSTQTEQSKKEFSSIEESLTKKTKEIYELTVQLGCLKEENNQYKLEQEELKQQFQERINEVKSRAENDYQSLLQDYQTFQHQCKIESDTVDTLRRQCEESAGKLKDQEEKIRRLQAMNEKLRSTSRIKKQSQFKLEQPSTQQLENDPPISSHYTSVGGNENKKPQSQEHSFQSIGSKRSKGASAHIRASQKIEKENDAQKVIMETLEPKIVEADKILKKTQHQQLVSHTNNLFKKQHQPILQTISAEGVSNRQNTNRDQGCLQVPPSRKKSAGVPSTVKTSLAFGSGVLKSNNSRINAINQPSATTLQAKALNPKEKTPTRPLVRSDLSHQHLLQPSVNKTTRPSQSNLSKSPAAISHQTSQMQKSPQLQPKPTPKLLQKPSQVMSAVSSQQTFQLNSNEDSIFDPKVLQLNEGTAPDHRRSQQNFTLLQRNPHQEVTLGGIQCDDSSSPDTPQIAPGMILHQHEKPTAYVMRSLESPTRILKQHAVTSSNVFESQQLLAKNASVSSTSTNQHAQIMSEMRNKLIDIQNNKQYIEQKIQEYEKKLQQLKGTSTSLVLSSAHHQHMAYCDMPRQQQHTLQRSGSGLLLQKTTR
ncbi:hypothetical protein FGO68_gene13837 [Halteria grandinella]|uniref:Uncharacterized protein n=1 Tax=Halteria grandinella TaxID=5974 RepID=A0A8J8NFJ8_HALGN|nr:hypothetical protein FGO68_gene13837 [Halteria grandinella]